MARKDNVRNTRNPTSALFKRLTRLLSGPLVNYRRQTERNLDNKKTTKYSSKYTSLTGREFKKIDWNNPFENFQSSVMAGHARNQRYMDFEQMEFNPDLSTVLDIYADEMTTSTELKSLLNIKCSNEEIKHILNVLYYDILNVEFNLYGWSRTMCKYGDLFLYIDIDEANGVQSLIALPVAEVRRIEGEDENNPNYIQFFWDANNITFENWQVAHMRILGNDKHAPFGTSVLDGARRCWRQLCYSKGTKVWIEKEGYKNIEDINIDEIVLSFDKEKNDIIKTRVKNIAYMGMQKVIEIYSNHRKIKVTPNHGIYVKDKDGKIVCKQAKDLIQTDGLGGQIYRNSDKLILPIKNYGNKNYEHKINKNLYSVMLKEGCEQSNIDCSRIKNNTEYHYKNIHSFLLRKHNRKIPYSAFVNIKNEFNLTDNDVEFYYYNSKKASFIETIEKGIFITDPEFCRFVGFMLGDGWIAKNKIGFALGVCKEQNDYYIELCKKILNSENYIFSQKEGTLSSQVNFATKEGAELFEQMGFKTGFLNKRIPKWIFELDLESKRNLIRGMMDADGGEYHYCSSNKDLITDFQILCQQSGVPCKDIKIDREEGEYCCKSFGKNIYRQTSYKLFVNMNEDKWINDDYCFQAVNRVVDNGEYIDTYDLEVEHECHNFTANGIIASNTLLEDAVMAYRIVRCLHGDSNVWTDSGYKKIKDINIGDRVYSYDKDTKALILSTVTDHIDNGKQRIWEIKSKHRSIRTNFNHPILVKNSKTGIIDYVRVNELIPQVHQFSIPTPVECNNEKKVISFDEEKYEWFGYLKEDAIKYLKENKFEKSRRSILLEISDKVGYSYERMKQFICPFGIKGIPYNIALIICKELKIPLENLVKYPKGMRNIDFNFPKFVDIEFSRFFGFLVGDGFVRTDMTSCGFAAGIRDDINQYYASIFKKYYPKVIFINDSRSEHKQVGWYRANSKALSNLLIDMGLTNNAHTKRIPEWIFKSSNAIKESFIDGLIDADGHRRTQNKTASMEIELCNKKLIEDLKELCHQLGWNVSSRIYKRESPARMIANNKMKTDKTISYSIYLTKEATPRFENILQINETTEYSNVYDIRVDNKFHNFVADGCIVHNSPERRVFYIDVGNISPQDIEQYMQQVVTSLKRNQIVDQDTGRVDLRYNPLCYFPDTKVLLTNGTEMTFKELSEKWERGQRNFEVYSLDLKNGGVYVPGEVIWAGKTGHVDKMVEITLDDGGKFKVTLDHKMMLRSGDPIKAKNLVPGDSLMPFYTKMKKMSATKGDNLYEQVYVPKYNKYVFTHRLIAYNKENIKMDSSGKVHEEDKEYMSDKSIHHKDFNKLNNSSYNLEIMNSREHQLMHKELASKNIIAYNKSEKHRKKCIETNIKYNKARKMGEAYNGSELHKKHNKIRSKAMTEMWDDENKRNKAKRNMSIEINDEIFGYIAYSVRILKEKISIDQFCEFLKCDDEFIKSIEKINNTNRDISKSINRHRLRKWIQQYNYKNYHSFLTALNPKIMGHIYENNLEHVERQEILNHKVVSVEIIEENTDVYNVTVDKYFNLAVKTHIDGIDSKITSFQSTDEDYYIPVRGNSQTKIDTLQGGQYTGDIDDIKYFRDKLFSAVKVPMSYVSRGEGSDEDKTTLAQKDIRFARTIQRLQRAVISELTKIGIIHLYVLGFRGEDLLSFSLSLNNPSKIAELQELEHWRTKFDVASSAADGYFSKRWISENLFNLSEDEILRNQREMYYDKWLEAKLESSAEEGEENFEDVGLDAEEDSEAATDDEEESVLLAAPGKRDDGYLTPNAKGKKYFPVISDKRNMGARKRNQMSKFSKELSSSGKRNTFKGYSELSGLSNGIYENKDSIYNEEEKIILKMEEEIKDLVENIKDKKIDVKNILNKNSKRKSVFIMEEIKDEE